MPFCSLQRSRRPRTTERTTISRSFGLAGGCFNEAVVRGRRRAPPFPKTTDCIVTLQRSRRPRTTESQLRPRLVELGTARFNEAVVRGRRRAVRRRGASRAGRGASTKPSSEDDGERPLGRCFFDPCELASTKPSSEDDGESIFASLISFVCFGLQRSRRPRTTEREEAGVVGEPRLPASTKPSSEDDGEAAPNPFLGRPAGPLQRSRRPRTTESPRASRSLRRSSAGFNEAVVRGRRRVATNPAVTTCNQVASTKPSSEDDGEGSRRTDEKSSAWRPVCESLPPRL